MAGKKILIVEDDGNIAELLQIHLRDEGFDITHAADGTQGGALLENQRWDAVILDIMLPGVDGLELCRQARMAAHYTPIIMISARASEVHRVLGLELGADDYLTKPFSMLELVARVKALFRRQQAMSMNLKLAAGILTQGDLTIDPIAREVYLRQKLVELTPREFELLYHFARHPGKVFSRLSLLNLVWGYQHEGYEHTVNTHINRLRMKIEANPAEPSRILTVWGKGYKFSSPENTAADE
ncbi:DNA-binding response regulator [Izhakiella australiensis]|uniref:Phosphate regulon transcriptional regulatory protein PhoB n=1 Tax=Izhakiella australiensis TaxID=1926881 RepID=A0A1S8YMT1_9GAMM|nr:response regulator transcription factor [Izhakiella australiensis]OON40222.1 DNA-binding response regulator [Izhakiella australiensis]